MMRQIRRNLQRKMLGHVMARIRKAQKLMGRPDCAASGRPALVPLDGRHYVACPWGLLQSSCCHGPGLAALVAVLDAVWGRHRVLADHLPGRRRAFDAWWDLHGAGGVLHHRPEVVLVGWHGPNTFLGLQDDGRGWPDLARHSAH